MDRHQREQLHKWMVSLADGDRGAFRAVYEAIRPILWRFAERSLGNAADAEDVAQEALLKVFGRASEFDRRREVLPWALGIAAYECRTFRRRASRRREDDEAGAEIGELKHGGRTPEEDVIERDLHAAAMEVLGTLRAQDVETILAAVQETHRPAIAGSTFRKRLERGLGRLRVAWRARHGSG
ncbi:MAG: RNA polymerase sigma factor [Gemmatimonadota bacterium]